MDAWQSFLARCLHTRLDTASFEAYVAILKTKHPLHPRRLADLFLRPSPPQNAVVLDPRVTRYLQSLLNLGLVDPPAVLTALLRYSSFNASTADPDVHKASESIADAPKLRWQSSYSADEAVLYRLAKHVSHGRSPQNRAESVDLIRSVTEWMRVICVASAAEELMQNMGSGTPAGETMAVRMALAALLVAVTENQEVLDALPKACPKDVRKAFNQAMASFLPLAVGAAPQITERLEMFRTQTLVPLEQTETKDGSKGGELAQILDTMLNVGIESFPVTDLPLLNSRAGLYIYLNSMLMGRPLVDDAAIFTYLNNRYQGDIQSTTIDLILASFDILSNAMFRNEGNETLLLLRSFLINKVPLLISALSTSMFAPLTPEFCITEALSQVDANAFPAFSSMFDESSNGNPFSDSVRQDFCFSCCLHGLIPESSIERLLGEVPMQTLPAGGRYRREVLVQQCSDDPERAERLVEELENMDGNVGAACHALAEVLGRFCAAKETMSLKTLCSHLARKPSSLDILLLFEKQSTILRPICELLDSWRYDEDQGEYQPVYEEFGSILLLVLAFVHRYDLTIVDLGVHHPDSFVAKLLVRGAISKPLETLSDAEKKHLDGWIHGLFDGEGGALGDELMSSCPPQDFYLLVPTLFRQIVLAFSTNHLSDESLKGGLEYLVDTFLLPSLVGAVTWLAHHLWEYRGDANAVLQILQTLIEPKSMSNEASLMHGAILNLIAAPLEHSLRWLQRHEPSRQDVEPLSRVLKTHLSFLRTSGSDHTELESWTMTPGGGLCAAVRHSVITLVDWSLNPTINSTPPSFSYRQILVATRMLGAKRVLQTLLDQLAAQTLIGNGSLALDVVTAIVCAPDASSAAVPSISLGILTDGLNDMSSQPPQRRLNLRDALKAAADTAAAKSHKPDDHTTQALVRLHRRVDAQMAPGAVPDAAAIALAGSGGSAAGAAAAHDALALSGAAVGLDPAGIAAAAGIAGDLGDGVQSLSDVFGAGLGDADMQMMDFGAGTGMGDDFGELRLDLGDGFS